MRRKRGWGRLAARACARRGMALAILVLVAFASADCSKAQPKPAPSVTLGMTFNRATAFYAAPFPSDDLRNADGTIAIAGFPNPNGVALVDEALAIIGKDAHGFALEGAVFFAATGALDPAGLPDRATSITPASPVFLMSVDPAAPDYLTRYPIDVTFAADGGDFGAPNLLALLPLQGTPLRPKTTYAAVVMQGLPLKAVGKLAASPDMATLAGGGRPKALSDTGYASYQKAIAALGAAKVKATDVAGVAAFTTDDPTAAMSAVTTDILSRPPPALASAWHADEQFADYCVYDATLPMPDYQAGDSPYDFGSSGGQWEFDASGKPIVQRMEMARVVVTIPRTPMPAGGYPTVVFSRTGAGGDRPLVDRGPQATNGGPPIVAGTGPAMYFAMEGFAGIEIDGPHGGIRNITNANEDFLMFNIFNAVALRDNVRESAVELALEAHILDGLSVDASACPGASQPPVKFDTSKLALMGHSMGATIAPLALAVEPRYRAAILSGAGASWIENVIYKQQPLAVAPAISIFLDYASERFPLLAGDPVLTLFQWAEEPADPLVYTRALLREPPAGFPARNILMEQGIVDHYIMPPIADATSLSLGLDLAGDALDVKSAEVGTLEPLQSVLQYSGRKQVAFPVSGNFEPLGGAPAVTAIVVQHPADGIEDGHEIVFQTEAPKHEYRCFLKGYAAGAAPLVPQGMTATSPCP